MTYRPDIDGLRAIAVLSVVLFHAGVAGLSGGFVGVDVFFVISGYLITGIVQNEVREGRFTIAGFYERRIRRIFPALLAMVAFTYVVAIRLYMPPEFAQYSGSVAATSAFGTNFLFWREGGYFNGPSDIKPLLNVWSLAVEEQFYLGFPPLLALLAKAGDRLRVAAVGIVLAASLGVSVWAVAHYPGAAFYVTPSRAWELMIGAMLALGAFPTVQELYVREILGIVGLAAVLYPVFFYSAATRFPGWAAVLPCVGAALLLHTGAGGTAVASLLSVPPLRFVGLISYSLYLFHWPMLAFAKYYTIRPVTGATNAIAVGIAVVLAVLSWRYVETPFRSRGFLSRRAIFALGGATLALFAGIGGAGVLAEGFPGRFPGYRHMAPPPKRFPEFGPCFLDWGDGLEFKGDACFITQSGKPPALLWGDSFAAHMFPGIVQHRHEIPFDVIQYDVASCAPIRADSAWRPECREASDRAFEIVRRYGIKEVILAARWDEERRYYSSFYDAQRATVDELVRAGAHVTVIGQSPDFIFWDVLDTEYRLSLQRRSTPNYYAFLSLEPDFGRKLEENLALGDRATFIDPMRYLCRVDDCPITQNGAPLYRDWGHYTVSGSTRAIGLLLPELRAQAWKH